MKHPRELLENERIIDKFDITANDRRNNNGRSTIRIRSRPAGNSNERGRRNLIPWRPKLVGENCAGGKEKY